MAPGGMPFRYYFVGLTGSNGYLRLEDAEDVTPDREFESGFALAVVDEGVKGNARYVRTHHGHWVPLRELVPVTPFEFHGKRYASLEGFWQMMKYPEDGNDPRATFDGVKWKHTRAEVAQMVSFDAKRAGTEAEANMKAMGIDWVTFEGRQMEYRPAEPGEHYRLIVAATWAKVLQNADVRRVLLSTGDLVLRPDHHQEPDAPAAWRYYEILTDIRRDLRAGGAR